MTSEDHKRRVAVLQAAPGKVLRGRGGHREPGVRQRVRFPPVELDDALGPHAPGFEVRADPERRHERHVALGELADGRVVEMVVVVVRHDHEVDRRHRAQGNGHGLEALGAGEPRRRRARSPDRIGEHAQAVDLDQHRGMAEPGGAQPAGGRLAPRPRADSSMAAAPRGTRRSPPQRNSLSVGIDAFGSRKPGMIGCTLRNRSPAQSGEALMRSSRAPSGFLPSDFMSNDNRIACRTSVGTSSDRRCRRRCRNGIGRDAQIYADLRELAS